MSKRPSNMDELFKALLNPEALKKASSFTPLEVTIRDTADGNSSTRKMKNVIIIGVMEDNDKVMQGMQGAFSMHDKAILSQAMDDMSKQLTPDDMMSDLIGMLFGGNDEEDE